MEHEPRKTRETYLLHTRKMDMEMYADTLESGGVNDLFVSVTVDASFTTEQVIPSSYRQILWIDVCSLGCLDGKTGLLTGLLAGKQGWKCPVTLIVTCCG